MLIQRGQAAGTFRAELEPAVVATAVKAMLKGIGMQAITAGEAGALDLALTRLGDLVEGWLTAGAAEPRA